MKQKQINKIIEYIIVKYGAYIIINSINKEIILDLPEEIDSKLSCHSSILSTFLFFNETPEIIFKDFINLNDINDFYNLVDVNNLVPLKNLKFKKVKTYIDKVFEVHIKQYNEILKNNQKNKNSYYLKLIEEL